MFRGMLMMMMMMMCVGEGVEGHQFTVQRVNIHLPNVTISNWTKASQQHGLCELLSTFPRQTSLWWTRDQRCSYCPSSLPMA